MSQFIDERNKAVIVYLFCILSNPRVIDAQTDEMAGLPLFDLIHY